MEAPGPRIDDVRRRRFEAHRISGGSEPLEAFLPPEGDPSRADTLEELVLIELEFRWKRWDGAGDAPSADDVVARHPSLGADAVRRIRDETDLLRGRFVRRSPLGPGTRFGRYELKERVGRGASAEVWRAWDGELRRDVAVKLAREELVGDELVTARLLREARSTAQLRHPAIVTVHEVSTRDGQPFIVSDFIEGPTLAREIARRAFAPDEAAAIVARLADALDYAHACGVVHRDVKPGNVLLPAEGEPVLADFGLAQLARAEAGLTRQGDVLGTPAYMAPEQAAGDVDRIDARSDVYALGAVLYELLTGRPPYAGASAASVLYAVVHHDPEPPRALRAGLPADLETVCRKAMAREPSGRYPDARALADDLRRFLARQPVAARPPGPWRRLRLWTRRNPALAATLAASAALVAVVAAVAFDRVLEERDRNRVERDHAQANLYRALVSEADARLAALDTGWYGHTRESVAAAALDLANRDVLALRELAARCEGVSRPSFEPVAAFAPHGGPVRRLAAIPGSDVVAGIGVPDEAWLRSAGDGSVFASRHIDGDVLRALAVTDDGGALLVGGDAGRAHVLALPDLREVAVHDAGAEIRSCGAASGRLAIGLADGRVELLAVRGDRIGRTATIQAHQGGVLATAFSPDGARLATSGEDGVLAEWDTATGEPVARHEVANDVRVLRCSPDGGTLACAALEDYGFGVRPLGGPPTFRGGLHESAVRDLAFAGPGRVVTASGDGTLRAWSTGFAPLAVADAGAGPIAAAAPLGADRIAVAHGDGRLRVWRLAESSVRQTFAGPHVAAFVPGTARLFTGLQFVETGFDGDALRTVGTRRISDAAAHAVRAWGAAAAPDGRLVASCGHAGAVKLVDAATGALVATLLDHGEPAWVVAFSPDGSTLASGSGRDAVLFDVAARAERARLTGHARLVTGVAFRPDGPRGADAPLVATVSLDGDLRLWDARDGRPLATLARFAGPLHGVCFSPDGTRVAVASEEGVVAVWDADAPRFGSDGAAREPSRRLTGHASAVWAVAWSADGALFASCDDRGRAVLRDGRTLEPLVTLRADVRRGRSVSFGDGGRLLAVGCFDSPSIAWDLVALRRRLADLGLDW